MTAIERAVAAIPSYLSDNEFSGSVRIATADEVLFEHAGGLADRSHGAPNAIDTRFGIASVTKTFTATIICRLVDQGALTFDARAVDVLPASKRPKTLSPEITLHHLLTHTSGIADYFDEVNLGAAAFDQVWLEHASYLFTRTSDFLPLFAHLPPLRSPGGNIASYCSAGFILLGLVIEELTGRSYIETVESDIFAVAGMDDSGFFRLDDVRPRVATGYVAGPHGTWKTNHYSIPVVGGPDGGAFSTVRDLASFLDALASGVFFADRTGDVMRTPHVRLEDISYGYGLAIIQDGHLSSYGHGGADPGFSARAIRYPELDLNVTMLGNTVNETDGVIGVFRSALSE